MKNIFKITVLLIILTLGSCAKPELGNVFEQLPATYYQYNAQQPITLDVVIIPTEGVVLEYDLMEEETNADYFHRFGIHLNFTRGERLDLDEEYGPQGGNVFLPTNYTDRKQIHVYVLPQDHIQFNAFGYAIIGHNNIVVAEDAQNRSTLAHEIGHILGLGHTKEEQYNLMHPSGSVLYNTLPKDLVGAQIDTMHTNAAMYDIKSKFGNISSAKQNIDVEPIIIF